MRQLFLLFLLVLPFVVFGQTKQEVATQHEAAVNLLLKQYPSAEVVDLVQLTASQKGLHEKSTCSSCPKESKQQQTTQSLRLEDDLATLEAKEQKLVQTLAFNANNSNSDKATLAKYERALYLVRVKIEKYKKAQLKNK